VDVFAERLSRETRLIENAPYDFFRGFAIQKGQGTVSATQLSAQKEVLQNSQVLVQRQLLVGLP
jgi:hypothetical protein